MSAVLGVSLVDYIRLNFSKERTERQLKRQLKMMGLELPEKAKKPKKKSKMETFLEANLIEVPETVPASVDDFPAESVEKEREGSLVRSSDKKKGKKRKSKKSAGEYEIEIPEEFRETSPMLSGGSTELSPEDNVQSGGQLGDLEDIFEQRSPVRNLSEEKSPVLKKKKRVVATDSDEDSGEENPILNESLEEEEEVNLQKKKKVRIESSDDEDEENGDFALDRSSPQLQIDEDVMR